MAIPSSETVRIAPYFGCVTNDAEQCGNHFFAKGNRFQDGVVGEMALIVLQVGEDLVYIH